MRRLVAHVVGLVVQHEQPAGARKTFEQRRLYRFETTVEPSLAGDFDAVKLDYDLPENPFFIRAIRDEIRELSPGLYLGQAYARTGGAFRLWLYFGLESPR